MGEWYESDFLSHLHIDRDEEVVMILLRQEKYSFHKSNACSYSYEKYTPFGLPIHGKYNEIGGLKDVKNKEDIIKYLNTIQLVHDRDDEGYTPFELTVENFEDFLEDVTQEEIYTKSGKLITRMFINETLYTRLIDDYKERTLKNNGHVYTYEQLFDSKCNRFIKSLVDKINQAEVYHDTETKEEDYFRGLTIPCFCDDLKEFRSAWLSNFMSNDDIVKYLLEQMYKHEELRASYGEYLKELVFFQYVLDSMRSGYLCVSGTGGEIREMWLQKILADYIIERCKAYVDEFREENICDDSDTDKRILSDRVASIFRLTK